MQKDKHSYYVVTWLLCGECGGRNTAVNWCREKHSYVLNEKHRELPFGEQEGRNTATYIWWMWREKLGYCWVNAEKQSLCAECGETQLCGECRERNTAIAVNAEKHSYSVVNEEGEQLPCSKHGERNKRLCDEYGETRLLCGEWRGRERKTVIMWRMERGRERETAIVWRMEGGREKHSHYVENWRGWGRRSEIPLCREWWEREIQLQCGECEPYPPG